MSVSSLRPGYYFSKEATNELIKINEDSKVWIVPIFHLDFPVLLDYPEVNNIARGSVAYGDYGLARKEIQDALKDRNQSTVRTFLVTVVCN